MVSPSGAKATALIQPPCWRSRIGSPEGDFQRRISRSVDPAARVLPSRDQPMLTVEVTWPYTGRSTSPALRFHSSTRLSKWPEANVTPSGDQANGGIEKDQVSPNVRCLVIVWVGLDL